MLRDAGVIVDQDVVAARAGTVLPRDWRGGVGSSASSVPPGAESWTDYHVELPMAEMESSGTQPAGLAAAIEEMSRGALAVVPARSAAWTSSAVSGLVSRGTSLGARLLANIRTGRLWGSRPPAALLLAELEGGEPPGPPPPADWDVGHFVELVGLMRGRAGELVLVRDSYPTLGWDGHYLQPPRVLADALQRGDGRAGGVLLVVPGERRADAAGIAGELALDVEMWDN
jgi:hypothetical protein